MFAKAKKYYILFLILILVAFIFQHAGLFLFSPTQRGGIPPAKKQAAGKNNPRPVQYQHSSLVIGGNKQEIHILEIDVSGGKAEVKPVLSHDSVFGFELLSSMVKRSRAFAGVNAGFFHQYGRPAGLVVIDGKIISNSTGKYPAFIMDGNKALIEEVKTKLWITNGKLNLDVDNINKDEGPGKWVVYTGEYGDDNRLDTENITAVIENNILKSLEKYHGKVGIPENGFLLSLQKPGDDDIKHFPFALGDKVYFKSEPHWTQGTQAYECGSWLLRDGRVVVPKKDEWVGLLTNHDPRTAIGVRKDGKVMMVVVDGRQPGYSTGLTGQQLAEFLAGMGVKDAAMLDGGASTEMIAGNKIVNRPSFKGRERMLGGGMIVTMKE